MISGEIILAFDTNIAIVFPSLDIAAQTMWSELVEHSYFSPLEFGFDGKPIYKLENYDSIIAVHSERDGVSSNHISDTINADLFIFASRHSAASGKPAILIHSPGNWGDITLGGNVGELAYTSAFAIKTGLLALGDKQSEYAIVKYSVDLEVTHHGPTDMPIPIIFMELGSNEDCWKDTRAALAVGEAILETAKSFLKADNSGEFYIGVGGNHYAYRFHKFLIENENAYVGHIVPKHSIDLLTLDLLQQAVTKTIEPIKGVLIDKKGTRSAQREKVKEFCSTLNIEAIMI